MCKTSAGCEVQDLASDPLVNQTLNEYFTVRALSGAMDNPIMLSGWLDKNELMDEYDILLSLEVSYAKWRERTRPKEPTKRKR